MRHLRKIQAELGRRSNRKALTVAVESEGLAEPILKDIEVEQEAAAARIRPLSKLRHSRVSLLALFRLLFGSLRVELET